MFVRFAAGVFLLALVVASPCQAQLAQRGQRRMPQAICKNKPGFGVSKPFEIPVFVMPEAVASTEAAPTAWSRQRVSATEEARAKRAAQLETASGVIEIVRWSGRLAAAALIVGLASLIGASWRQRDTPD